MRRRDFLALGGSAAVSGFAARGLQAQSPAPSPVRVGFGTVLINDAAASTLPFHDDIEAAAMFLADGQNRYALVALDLAMFSHYGNLKLRERIAERVNIPVENILLHCTHNHSSLDWNLIVAKPEIMIERVSAAIATAEKSAQPAEMAFSVARVGNRFSINRRNFIDNDLGTLTFWYGYHYPDDKGTVDARWLLTETLQRMFAGEIPEKYRTDEPLINRAPVDELLQLLVFREAHGGKILGSVIRFATHTQLASCASKLMISACVPGYAKRRLREALGGQALFLVGPCGDLVPKEYLEFRVDPAKTNIADTPFGPAGNLSVVSDEELWSKVESEGRAMADAALSALKPDSFVPLTRLAGAYQGMLMPLREDIPARKSGYEEAKKKAMTEYKQALGAKAPIGEIKKLAEVVNRAYWMKDIVETWYELSDQDLSKRSTPYDLFALVLNDVYLAALPAETVMATTDYLRSNTYGERLITVTEGNADIGYIATREQFPFGSYEVNCGVNHISGEQQLREAARDLILRM